MAMLMCLSEPPSETSVRQDVGGEVTALCVEGLNAGVVICGLVRTKGGDDFERFGGKFEGVQQLLIPRRELLVVLYKHLET
jgi:hypothetical protein